MFERIARRWHVWSIELKRFRARDERVAARDRRLRRRRGGRLHCGCLCLVSDGGRADCQRECRCDCVHPHPLPPSTRRAPTCLHVQGTAFALETGPISSVEGRNAGDLLTDHRSEEHTSELQSPMYLVCRLLLEKKKNKQ